MFVIIVIDIENRDLARTSLPLTLLFATLIPNWLQTDKRMEDIIGNLAYRGEGNCAIVFADMRVGSLFSPLLLYISLNVFLFFRLREESRARAEVQGKS